MLLTLLVGLLLLLIHRRRRRMERDLRDREKRLTLAITAGRVGTWEVDLTTGRMVWIKGTENLFGLEPGKFGGTLEDFIALVHSGDRERVRRAILESNSQGMDHEVEFRVPKTDGGVRWLVNRGTVLKNEAGDPLKVLGMVVDVTDRKLFEERLVQATEQLWRSNKELDQFAYVSSHDLQEPLRKIAIYAQMLGKKFLGADADTEKYTNAISTGVYRMQRLIDDVLLYSRSTREQEVRGPVDLRSVMDKVLSDLEFFIEDKDARVFCDPLPVVIANPTQMYQLLQNLVRNAIKFHGSEAPCVRVSAQIKEGTCIISVQDNGIGIEPKYQEQIFRVFQRLHGRDKYPGSGIGLALCKKIVEQHGGKIWVESRPGVGATFHFTIPSRRRHGELVAQS